MSITEHEWREEQERVDEVVRQITERTLAQQEQLGDLKADIVEIRTNFWDDVTVNFEDPDDRIETYLSLKQQAEVLAERERSHRLTQNEVKTLLRLRRSPYFGRIDFQEAGEAKDVIYLGIASFLDDSEENFLIYDWRAPVSSLYYDYGPGPAQYNTPGGLITGELELKRQFIIRDGTITSLFDTGVTIGDELLQEVLGKQADNQMKSIVATIQKEQNRIIRNEKSRMLIVQGAAGSGKTSAALQRVAYLLYRYRETLTADNIVLFSPNPLFNSYVRAVLPELGEENMQQTTFQEYLEHRLGKLFRLQDPFEQMEYVLTAMEEPGYEARIEGIRYKAGTSFMSLLERYAASLGTEGLLFRSLRFRGDVLLSADHIAASFYQLDPAVSIPNRMQLLSEQLLLELEALEEEVRSAPWVEEEVELLDKEDYLRAYNQLRRKKRFTENTFDDLKREQDLLAAMVVRNHFKPLRARVKKLRFLNLPALYRQLFADPQFAVRFAGEDRLPERWHEICRSTVARLEERELAYEDATAFLYLQERLLGVMTNNSVRHVFIDEAQDYSPFQFEYVKRLFPRARMTVLGDLNQAIYAHAQDGDAFEPLTALYGPEETETIILTRSYRSTRPIVEFTKKMIPEGEQIVPFNRDGEPPTVTSCRDGRERDAQVAKRVQAMLDAGHQTVAVICKTAQESERAYAALRELVPLRLIGKETGFFEKGALIIPSYLAKGMEFDAVILYDASREKFGRPSERRLFYTACTRAMHELHLYAVGELSPLLLPEA